MGNIFRGMGYMGIHLMGSAQGWAVHAGKCQMGEGPVSITPSMPTLRKPISTSIPLSRKTSLSLLEVACMPEECSVEEGEACMNL